MKALQKSIEEWLFIVYIYILDENIYPILQHKTEFNSFRIERLS